VLSERPPQPGSEVLIQRAPERLLERLLEAPAACSERRAQSHAGCWPASLLASRQRAPADRRQQEGLRQASGLAPAVLGKADRARLQHLHRLGTTPWRRGRTPARPALAPPAGRRLPSVRTSAGSWSRRMAKGPAVPAALDSRAAVPRCGIWC